MRRYTTPLLAAVIFLLNLALNVPLFMPGEMPFRGSIEGGYVGMARFLSQHPNPWGWNPLAYCGLPTQFMYVPNMPYLGALFIRLLPHASPDHIFRTIVSLMTCLGPVTLFFFALYFTGSRRWALVVAVAYSCMSPSYALFPAVERDHDLAHLAWRVKVMAKYGEGPHNTGLMLLPLAVIGLWRAATGRGYPRILASALLLAAIPLTNWVAAFGLAISCAMMLLAALGEKDFRYWRAFAAAGLAYLFASFWLTPSFVKTILFQLARRFLRLQSAEHAGRADCGNARKRLTGPGVIPADGRLGLFTSDCAGHHRFRVDLDRLLSLRFRYRTGVTPLCHRIQSSSSHSS